MDKELYSKGEFQISIEGGNVKLMYDGKGMDVSLVLEGEYFLDKLAEAIPGQVDDAVIELIKAALKG